MKATLPFLFVCSALTACSVDEMTPEMVDANGDGVISMSEARSALEMVNISSAEPGLYEFVETTSFDRPETEPFKGEICLTEALARSPVVLMENGECSYEAFEVTSKTLNAVQSCEADGKTTRYRLSRRFGQTEFAEEVETQLPGEEIWSTTERQFTRVGECRE